MSERFTDGSELEQRSSVQIETTAKGDAKVRVKVYVGEDVAAVDAAKQLALRVYNETIAALTGPLGQAGAR